MRGSSSRAYWDFTLFPGPPNSEALPCSSCCIPYRPLSTMQPSLMTRIWSALTTVESLKSQRSVTHHTIKRGPRSLPAAPVLYLCATTMVVRLAHTLAREAWIALSLDVSSAEVAYREDLGKTAPPPKSPVDGGCKLLAEALGIKKNLVCA